MSDLDNAVEALTLILDDFHAVVAADVANLFQIVHGETWDAESRRRLIELLSEHAADLIGAHVGLVADTTSAWYGYLVPSSDFVPTVPQGIVTAERIETSIAFDQAAQDVGVSLLEGSGLDVLPQDASVLADHHLVDHRVGE
ncbi:hypothetical protein, partial [Mycolicibacterium holsaticum]|uniref:hypothetical protein n=1 Tax=Mycolicibacterium holsaticum TaxID=152142 RepID=UPI001042678D